MLIDATQKEALLKLGKEDHLHFVQNLAEHRKASKSVEPGKYSEDDSVLLGYVLVKDCRSGN